MGAGGENCEKVQVEAGVAVDWMEEDGFVSHHAAHATPPRTAIAAIPYSDFAAVDQAEQIV